MAPRRRQGPTPARATPAPVPGPTSAVPPPSVTAARAAATAAGLVALTLFAFWGVWSFDFVQLDDPFYVVKNPDVTGGLTWNSVVWAFTSSHAANWHPLTWLSHMLDVEWFGVDAGPAHAVNLVLHAISTLLLFGLLLRTTRALGASAFVAALFAAHPLHVESVAWVSERKDVLSTMFWLLTMAAWVWYLRRPDWRRYALVALSLALGLMAKPMLVTLPLVLVLFDVWPLQRAAIRPGWWPVATADLWRLIREKLPLLALSAASSVATFVAQRTGGAVMSLTSLPLEARAENAILSYARYLVNTMLPVDLVVFYPHRASPSTWEIGGSVLLIVTVTALAVRFMSRAPYLGVGWFWYLGTLVPVIGLVQVGRQAMADRYTYVPLIGIFILVAWGARQLAVHRPSWRQAVAAAGVVVVLISAVLTRAQVRHWEDDAALWTHALQVAGRLDERRTRLAVFDLLKDNNLEALRALVEAREGAVSTLGPATARHFLGRLFLRHGQTAESLQSFSEAIALSPGVAVYHADYGLALAHAGDQEGAVAHYREAIRLDPGLGGTYNDLGIALSQLGRTDEAIVHFAEAARLLPESPDPRRNLGVALANAGRLAEAAEAFRDVLRLKPEDAAVRQALDEISRRLRSGGGGR